MIKAPWRSGLAVVVGIGCLLTASITLAAEEKTRTYPTETVVSHDEKPATVNGVPLYSSQTVLVGDRAVKLPAKAKEDADADGIEISAVVRTVTKVNTYKSLVGLTVARHTGRTWFTFENGYLRSDPKGFSQDWWTAPLNYVNGHNEQWDWYQPGNGGTGRSNLQLTLVFGVPTPWGPIGSTYTSRILTWFNGWGSWS